MTAIDLLVLIREYPEYQKALTSACVAVVPRNRAISRYGIFQKSLRAHLLLRSHNSPVPKLAEPAAKYEPPLDISIDNEVPKVFTRSFQAKRR
jgi:hypothetical protein